MRAIDTNVLVRLLTGDDARQTATADAFVKANSPVWVSHVVLAETMWVLESVYSRNHREIAAALTTLLNHQLLVLQEPEVVEAAIHQFSKKRAPEFSDCLILEIARKAGHLPLGTFDASLSALEGAQRL